MFVYINHLSVYSYLIWQRDFWTLSANKAVCHLNLSYNFVLHDVIVDVRYNNCVPKLIAIVMILTAHHLGFWSCDHFLDSCHNLCWSNTKRQLLFCRNMKEDLFYSDHEWELNLAWVNFGYNSVNYSLTVSTENILALAA